LPLKTFGKTLTSVRRFTDLTIEQVNSPSAISAAGVMHMPPPYDDVLPIAISEY
jgi:hypothetical protein